MEVTINYILEDTGETLFTASFGSKQSIPPVIDESTVYIDNVEYWCPRGNIVTKLHNEYKIKPKTLIYDVRIVKH